MKKYLGVLFLVLLSVGLSSCGSDEPVPAVTGEASTAPAPAAAPVPAPTTGKLLLHNHASAAAITNFYLSPVDQATWGADLLSAALPASVDLELGELSPNTYDAKARVVGALSVYSSVLHDIPIVAGATYPLTAIDSSYTGSLKISNGGAVDITEIYITLETNPSWGSNQLSSVVAPVGSMHFYDIPAGTYDLKVVWSNSEVAVAFSQPIISLTLLSLSATY